MQASPDAARLRKRALHGEFHSHIATPSIASQDVEASSRLGPTLPCLLLPPKGGFHAEEVVSRVEVPFVV